MDHHFQASVATETDVGGELTVGEGMILACGCCFGTGQGE